MYGTDTPVDRLRARGIAIRVALAAVLVTAPLQVARSAPESLRDQVFAAERAFARSMADRSIAEFSARVADEAVFFTGAVPLRGKSEVVAGWSAILPAR